MSMSQYTIQQFIVDAFTDSVFKGNPAAVCLLDKWLSDDTLQNIAKENNLSETAFVLFRFIEKDVESLTFATQSGELLVTKKR